MPPRGGVNTWAHQRGDALAPEQRIGAAAYRRIGVSAYRHIGVWWAEGAVGEVQMRKRHVELLVAWAGRV